MGWISVVDEIPNHDNSILYCEYKGKTWDIGIAHWINNKWVPNMYSSENFIGFTHWQPLPSAPAIISIDEANTCLKRLQRR